MVYTKGHVGSAIENKAYQPTITVIYFHLNQDGKIDIVDKNGDFMDSLPHIITELGPLGKPIYHAFFAGTAPEQDVQLPYYKAPSSHWNKK